MIMMKRESISNSLKNHSFFNIYLNFITFTQYNTLATTRKVIIVVLVVFISLYLTIFTFI